MLSDLAKNYPVWLFIKKQFFSNKSLIWLLQVFLFAFQVIWSTWWCWFCRWDTLWCCTCTSLQAFSSTWAIRFPSETASHSFFEAVTPTHSSVSFNINKLEKYVSCVFILHFAGIMSMRSYSVAMKERSTLILLPSRILSQRWLVSLETKCSCKKKLFSFALIKICMFNQSKFKVLIMLLCCCFFQPFPVSVYLTHTFCFCFFLLRSDNSQHPVCLPYEDQKGVALLHSHASPAGQALCCAAHHSAHCQHVLHGADGSRDWGVPPLKSLCAISLGEGSLLWAAAAGGALILKCFIMLYVKTLLWCILVYLKKQ